MVKNAFNTNNGTVEDSPDEDYVIIDGAGKEGGKEGGSEDDEDGAAKASSTKGYDDGKYSPGEAFGSGDEDGVKASPGEGGDIGEYGSGEDGRGGDGDREDEEDGLVKDSPREDDLDELDGGAEDGFEMEASSVALLSEVDIELLSLSSASLELLEHLG
ncbi:MAG: hypothetical protein Q9204_000931 [Flavoplaca sp. TL-2023a]